MYWRFWVELAIAGFWKKWEGQRESEVLARCGDMRESSVCIWKGQQDEFCKEGTVKGSGIWLWIDCKPDLLGSMDVTYIL